METQATENKIRRQMLILAASGFLVAVVIWAYSELTNASPPPPVNFPLWTAFVLFCPPSLLTVPLIDVEPGSMDFAIEWFVVGVLNATLYVAMGGVIAGLWKRIAKARVQTRTSRRR
jgi:CDP-diglyceride synthetase